MQSLSVQSHFVLLHFYFCFSILLAVARTISLQPEGFFCYLLQCKLHSDKFIQLQFLEKCLYQAFIFEQFSLDMEFHFAHFTFLALMISGGYHLVL